MRDMGTHYCRKADSLPRGGQVDEVALVHGLIGQRAVVLHLVVANLGLLQAAVEQVGQAAMVSKQAGYDGG